MYIKVRIFPGSKRERLEKVGDTECTVWVKEAAKNNAANEKMISLIKDAYEVTRVRIISGHHHPSKIVDIA